MARRLYGRETDLALINGLIDGIRDGGAALMIGGDPGIGKSALLDAARELATDRGMRVLYLCGVTSETHLPFGRSNKRRAPFSRRPIRCRCANALQCRPPSARVTRRRRRISSWLAWRHSAC